MESANTPMSLNETLLDEQLFESASSYGKEKKKRKLLLPITVALILAAAGTFVIWKYFFAQGAQTSDTPTPREYTAVRGDIRISYETDGVVSLPFSYIDPDVQAELLEIYVSKGDEFKKGDLLALLSEDSLQDALAAANESYLSASDAVTDAVQGVKDAEDAVTDALKAVTDAEENVTTVMSAIDDEVKNIEKAKEGVKEAEAAVIEAEAAVETAKLNVTRQEASYKTALITAEDNLKKSELDIATQKHTISELQSQIAAAKNELALMEQLPDEYSANEVTTKKNSLASLELKLTSENNSLNTLERKAEIEDTTVLQASMSLQDAKDAVQKAENNVQKAKKAVLTAEEGVITAQNNLKKAQDNVQKARDTVNDKKTAVERARNNVTKSENNLLKAERNLQKAAEAVLEAEENTRKAQIYAPEDGTVMGINKQPGQSIGPVTSASTTNSFIIYTPVGAMYTAETSIPELDINSVFEGQMAEIEIDAYEGGILTGELSELSNFASSGSNNVISYKATASFSVEDSDGIRDQMNCTVTYITKEVKDIIRIPNDAVSISDGKSYVTVKLASGETEERQVTTGFSDGNYCEIVSGLSQGETVLSKTLTNSPSSNNTTNNNAGANNVFQSGGTIAVPNMGGGGGGGREFVFQALP